MTPIQAAVLGIIQGITEFLPISSSGHLIILPYFLGWKIQSLSFDVILHLATACAVVAYFYKDWTVMARSLFADILTGKINKISTWKPATRQLVTIIVVSIPVAIAGFWLESYAENFFRSPILVAL